METVNRVRLFRSPAWLDERAFDTIFTEHYARVFAILFRLTGDRAEADDLTAETFWRLWERPPASAENLAGWLYRVATRTGYNRLRANRRRENYEAQSGSDALPFQSPADPARMVEQRSERERVRTVLRKMPLRDVQVLILRHSDLSYKEIAAALDINAASVGKLLSRAEDRFEVLYRQGDNNASE
jgi:RNA polymerase sigma-70 factor (ECF subfamily)